MLSKTVIQPATETKFAWSLRYLDLVVATLVVGRCAWVFSQLMRSPGLPLRLAQDDFYYYLKVAQNLAWFHRSSFFETTLTNGYHPLYFLVLTVLSFFVRTLPGVFRFLWVLDTLSAAAVFFLTRQLFRRVASPLLANALAVLLTSLCLTQICDQMEVTLALPFGFAFLLAAFVPARALTPRRAMAMGLLGALTFLSRLDAGLLIALWVLGALCTREYRGALTPRIVAGFVATCLPLPLVYFWVNHHYFHTVLPVSGMAKELRHGRELCMLLPGSMSGTTQILAFAAIGTAIVAWALRRYLAPRERVLLFAVLATPYLFYFVEMLLSDWPVWNWYFYVLRFSALGLGVVLAVFATRPLVPLRYPRLRAFVRGPQLGAALCVLALLKLSVANYRVDRWMVEVQEAAGTLDTFARTHPGVYAMGDRAGMFAVSTSNPVLQAEGLVMDRAYLDHLRAEQDLRSVLSSYGVNYYVAFVFSRNDKLQFGGGCFHAMEPSIAGPSSYRMRSDFCEAPLYQFSGFDGQYLVYRIQPG